MNRRLYITSFGNVQRYCQDFVSTSTFSCAQAYTTAIFKFQNLTKIGLVFKEMVEFILLTYMVKSQLQFMISEDFLNLRVFLGGVWDEKDKEGYYFVNV